jgi:hypothetical protein
LTSRNFTIPGGKSGGRLCSRSGRYTPQADLPFFDRASARHMQSCSVSQVAQCDLRSEFRGKPRQAVRALPRALAATDADHNKGIEGEAVAIVQALACSLFVPSSSSAARSRRPAAQSVDLSGLRKEVID